VILALLTLPPRKPIALRTLLRVPRRQAPLLKAGEVDAVEIGNHDVAGGAGQHRGVVGPGDPAGLFVRPAAAGASPGCWAYSELQVVFSYSTRSGFYDLTISPFPFTKAYELWTGIEKILIAEFSSFTVSSGPERV
jgi:hypothetical protein